MQTKKLIKLFREKNLTISSMESCTGGEFASEITNHPNSSDIFKFSAITYSNDFKIKFGVSEKMVKKFSVYSNEVALEMAKAICNFSRSTIGVGITGKLGRVDKNNICESENNKVYVAIFNSKTKKSSQFEMIVNCKTRKASKNEVVKKIVEKILNFVNK